ncbi:MAG: hypothetical protein B7733_01035 [Myxococcales bacterium FL481]|nr:MAG: hypothetical protein B7733_01035 [Myxococcales bacterium FL481]
MWPRCTKLSPRRRDTPMPSRYRGYEEEDAPRASDERSLANRLAWLVIGLVGVLVLLRATIVTVVTVEGAGMEPTIRDGDLVLLVRHTGQIARGDVVVYEPLPTVMLAGGEEARPPRVPLPGEAAASTESATAASASGPPLPNTAVVDRAKLERNWQELQSAASAPAGARPPLRVARVLAVPGDVVAFRVPGAALGLAINGQPLRQKDAMPARLPLTAVARGGTDAAPATPTGGPSAATPTAPAYEWLDDLRYPVRPDSRGTTWVGMDLPADGTPVQVTAEAYLLLADNRPDGACCDSRALGWISAGAISGEIYARLERGHEAAHRGLEWLP